jgi:3-dehydroquinate synthase
MSDQLAVVSLTGNYNVIFVENFAEVINDKYKENTFFIIDEKLIELHKDLFANILKKEYYIHVEVKEQNKTLDYCQNLIQFLIGKNIRKNYTLIALGGGIIQDITGFVASILFRGIRWEFFPTTLLAQADSCIGSKTSINFGGYKNLLGGFYPPSQIYIDLGFLETLPADEIKSGIGEILHFYLIAGSRLSEELMDNYDELIAYPKKLKGYMLESLKIKKNVIEVDEFDKNERNLFNYGHTFGHAIEAVSGYEVSHGQAVTMGMDIANYVSLNLGYLNEEKFESMHKILANNMPSFRLQDNMVEDFFEALSRDKKNIGKNLGCILTSGPGSMKKVQIPLDDKLKNIILSYFKVGC